MPPFAHPSSACLEILKDSSEWDVQKGSRAGVLLENSHGCFYLGDLQALAARKVEGIRHLLLTLREKGQQRAGPRQEDDVIIRLDKRGLIVTT